LSGGEQKLFDGDALDKGKKRLMPDGEETRYRADHWNRIDLTISSMHYLGGGGYPVFDRGKKDWG